MTKSPIDKIIFSAMLLLAGLVFFSLTLPLGRMAQMVPIRVLVPTIALLLVQLVIDWKVREKEPSGDGRGGRQSNPFLGRHHDQTSSDPRSNPSAAAERKVREYPILLLLGVLPVSIYLVGFILSATLFIWFYYRFYFKKSLLLSASLSLGAAIILYALLVLLLGMDIRSGLIWNLSASAS
jgi:hypothetical protein